MQFVSEAVSLPLLSEQSNVQICTAKVLQGSELLQYQSKIKGGKIQ